VIIDIAIKIRFEAIRKMWPENGKKGATAL
jgi:hypothetical protein